jgi:hAT family protein
MVNSINMGWWVLSKYYQQSDEAPVYATALLLHPSRRKRYIDINWVEDWREPALTAARQLWLEYKDRPISPPTQAESGNLDRQITAYDLLAQSLDVTEATSDEDEFEKFINSPPHKITGSPLAWWCREEQRIEYPHLHQLAIDILSIPPMSDDPERVFSGVRRTISWDRARLGVANVEKTELLGNWNKNDLIRQLYVAVEDEIVDLSGSDGEVSTATPWQDCDR